MGCPVGALTQYLRPLFGQYDIQTRHNDLFFSHYNLFLGKRKEKLAQKARVKTQRVYRIVLMGIQ